MPSIALQPVGQEAAPILANLFEFYCHDLSAHFALRIGADGRFGYPHLSLYWEQPESRFAFFIMADNELAGFALATRGSSATRDRSDFDVAEFFVLRMHRRLGIGAVAAAQLWDRLPGHWVVRAAIKNEAAVVFWRRAVSNYARDEHIERTLTVNGVTRQVFEFESHTV
jgi:predicted acetyltransferase